MPRSLSMFIRSSKQDVARLQSERVRRKGEGGGKSVDDSALLPVGAGT